MTRRLLSAIVVCIAAAAALVLAWPQLFRLEQVDVVSQIVALRPLAVLIALALVVLFVIVALIGRGGVRRTFAALAVVGLAFSAVNVAVLATRGWNSAGMPEGEASAVRVLNWNTLGDATGAEAVARLALDEGADVVSLPETSRDLGLQVAAIMAAEGRTMQSFTVAYDEFLTARSTTLLISADLGEYTADTDVSAPRTTAVLPSVVATPVSGDGPTLVSTHPVAPVPAELASWRLDLQWLAETCADDNVIVAGDTNSTLDHYTSLAVDGAALGSCSDAALETDAAALGTWPTTLPSVLGAPIDRVLSGARWQATAFHVIDTVDDAGSDHRPVVADLVPTD